MIWLYMIENHPWVLWSSLVDSDYARWGEWAWVGRAYGVS